jgi:hypothetical protein
MADEPKNKAAQSMARARWAKTTPEQRLAHARVMVAARAARRGDEKMLIAVLVGSKRHLELINLGYLTHHVDGRIVYLEKAPAQSL